MENDVTTETFEYLKKMAKSIIEKDTTELSATKAELDEYAGNIISKMPFNSREVMNREFEKCKRCAREWIKVYKDSHFNPAVKEDILKEEVIEFFFSMNVKIVAVQKNFFLLAMVEEILSPGSAFTEQQRAAKIAKSRIRIQAREQGLTASYKEQTNSSSDDKPATRLWYFGDETNFLQSSEDGLGDDEALNYLLD